MVANFKQLFSDVSFLLKFIVWILLIIGNVFLGLGDVGSYDRYWMQTIVVALIGSCIIITAFLIVYIFDEPHKLYELVYLIAGGVLNLESGILNLIEYTRREYHRTWNSLILSIVCLAASILMIVDIVWKLVK